MIKKVWQSCWMDTKLFIRNRWFWLFLAMIVLAVITYFFFIIHGQLRPGTALLHSRHGVQVGIVAAMITGYMLMTSEQWERCAELFWTVSSGLWIKGWGKLGALLIVLSVFVSAVLLILYAFYWLNDVPAAFYWQSFGYVVLYGFIPFVVAGLIGMLIALWTQRIEQHLVVAYGLIMLCSLLIGPSLPIHVLQFGEIADVVNFHAVYGFPLEMQSWFNHMIWLGGVLVAFGSHLMYIHEGKIWAKRTGRVLVPLALVTVLCVLLAGQEDQAVYRDTTSANRLDNYDHTYYTHYVADAFVEVEERAFYEGVPAPIIDSYDIDVRAGRTMTADVQMTLRAEETTDALVFTLYHLLDVEEISMLDRDAPVVETGESADGNESPARAVVSFEREKDQIRVQLPREIQPEETITLQMTYAGSSSPFLFANERAVMLPGSFPWYPKPGAFPAFISHNPLADAVPFQFVQPTQAEPAQMTVRYSGPGPVFTSLEKSGQNVWQGKRTAGVTIVAGSMMTEQAVGEERVIYPQKVRLIDLPHRYGEHVSQINEWEQMIRRDFDIEQDTAEAMNQTVLIPLPVTTEYGGVWHLGNHRIVSTHHAHLFVEDDSVYSFMDWQGQTDWEGYNGQTDEREAISFGAEIRILPLLVDAFIRDIGSLQQTESMRTFFTNAYVSWLLHREYDVPIRDGSLLPTQFDGTAGELATQLADWFSEQENEATVRSFFQQWRQALQDDPHMEGSAVQRLLDHYM